MSTRPLNGNGNGGNGSNGNEPSALRRRIGNASRVQRVDIPTGNGNGRGNGGGNQPQAQVSESMEAINSSQNTVGPSRPGLKRPAEWSSRDYGDSWAIVPVRQTITQNNLARLIAPINRNAATKLLRMTRNKQTQPFVMLGSQNSSMREPVNEAFTYALGPPEDPGISFLATQNGVQVLVDPGSGMVTPLGTMSLNVPRERRPSRMGQIRNRIIRRIEQIGTHIRQSLMGLPTAQKRQRILQLRETYLEDFTMPKNDMNTLKDDMKIIKNNETKEGVEAARKVRFAKARIQKIFADYSNQLKRSSRKHKLRFNVANPNIRENTPLQQIAAKIIEYAQFPALVFQYYFVEEAPLEPIQPAVPSAAGRRAANTSRAKVMSKLERNLRTYVGDVNTIIAETSAEAARKAEEEALNRGNNPEAIQAARNTARNAARIAETMKPQHLFSRTTRRAIEKWNAYTKQINPNLELPKNKNNIQRYLNTLKDAGININNYGSSKTRAAAGALRRAQAEAAAAEAMNE